MLAIHLDGSAARIGTVASQERALTARLDLGLSTEVRQPQFLRWLYIKRAFKTKTLSQYDVRFPELEGWFLFSQNLGRTSAGGCI